MKKYVEMLTFMVAIVVLLMASTASAVTTTIYSEDFEGGADPESLNSGTFGAWAVVPGTNDGVVVTSSVPHTNPIAGGITGQAIEGDAGGQRFGASEIAPAGLDTTDPLAEEYELTFDAYTVGSSGAGTFHAGMGFTPTNGPDVQDQLGLLFLRGGNGGWRFQTTGIGGGIESLGNQFLFNDREVAATITIDLVNNEVRASLVDIAAPGNNHNFTPVPFTPGQIAAFDSLFVFQENLSINDPGMDIDNIHVTKTAVPEPATMGLLMLSLAGLSMFRPKR